MSQLTSCRRKAAWRLGARPRSSCSSGSRHDRCSPGGISRANGARATTGIL